MSAIQAAIEQAMITRKWSLPKVADAIGLHINSLARWRDGSTRSYDITALIKLFELAGLSMDQAFGLANGMREVPVVMQQELDLMRAEIEVMKQQQAQLTPLQQLVAAMLGNATPVPIAPPPIPEPTPEERKVSGAAAAQRSKLTQDAQDAVAKLAAASKAKQAGKQRKTGGI